MKIWLTRMIAAIVLSGSIVTEVQAAIFCIVHEPPKVVKVTRYHRPLKRKKKVGPKKPPVESLCAEKGIDPQWQPNYECFFIETPIPIPANVNGQLLPAVVPVLAPAASQPIPEGSPVVGLLVVGGLLTMTRKR